MIKKRKKYKRKMASTKSWITDLFRWCPTSAALLEQAEKKLFSYLKRPYELSFVEITSMNNHSSAESIRTVVIKTEATEKLTPLVLLHGFASGIGLWVLNFDKLSCDRPLYALDILGFGRSSRPPFSRDATEAENQFVECIEEWRKQVGLEKFILLGHSMGGFLAASYALRYPEKIKHLILADPWGFPEPETGNKKIELPLWVKVIGSILQPFNPLAGLRAAGPWGPQLVERFRPDIIRNFELVVEDPADVANYIYHCNAQIPSGESAFKSMAAQFGWAKIPMINRISQLKQDIPITFIYGSRSWVDCKSGLQVKGLRKDSFVEVKLIQGAGHHVYADKSGEFNNFVNNICQRSDLVTSMSSSDMLKKKVADELEQQTEAEKIANEKEDSVDMPVTL